MSEPGFYCSEEAVLNEQFTIASDLYYVRRLAPYWEMIAPPDQAPCMTYAVCMTY